MGEASENDSGEGTSEAAGADSKQNNAAAIESSIRSSLPASAAASVPPTAPFVSVATSQFLNDVLQAAQKEAEAANQGNVE